MSNWSTPLDKNREVLSLWAELGAKVVQAKQFGWGQNGIGGKWSLQAVLQSYVPGRKRTDAKESFHVAAKFQTAWRPFKDCLGNQGLGTENNKFFIQNYLFPQWFFDWGKRYLFVLRSNQPSFGATPEVKLVWTTHVAWTVNMMLSATNVHGSFLSMALYEEATGDPYSQWSGNGAYMFPSLHFRGLPGHYAAAVDDLVNRSLNTLPPNAAIDVGAGIFGKDGKELARSLWQGAPWALPFETRRYRWAETSLQGKMYGFALVNDPHYADDGRGGMEHVGSEVLNRYTRWSYAVPWILGIQTWGTVQASRVDGFMAQAALQMSTFFGWDRGDRDFWAALGRWKKETRPALRAVADPQWTKRNRALYRPNEEFGFRAHAPAMADLLLRCDYSSLVSKGLNLWWRFNIGSLETNAASFATTPDPDVQFNADGSLARGPQGELLVPLVATTKHIDVTHGAWESAEEKRMYRGIIMNVIRSVIAVIQALYGNYGSLVGAARGWYDLVNSQVPKPEDQWEGVPNLLPPVMRESLIAVSWKNGTRIDTDWRSGPGSPVLNGLLPPFVMATMRNAVMDWERMGGPVQPSGDLLKLYVAPKGPKSPTFPELPPPGEKVLEEPVTDWDLPSPPTALPPLAPPAKAEGKGVGWGWLAAAAVVVGSYTVYRTQKDGR